MPLRLRVMTRHFFLCLFLTCARIGSDLNAYVRIYLHLKPG